MKKSKMPKQYYLIFLFVTVLAKTGFSIENAYRLNIERYIENLDSFPDYVFFGFIREFENEEKNEVYEIKQNQPLKNLNRLFESFNILAVKKSIYDTALILKLNIPNPLESPFLTAMSPANSSINTSVDEKEIYFNNPKNLTKIIEYYRIIKILDKSIYISNTKDVSFTKTGEKTTTKYKPDKFVIMPKSIERVLDSTYDSLKKYYLTDTLIKNYHMEESKLHFNLRATIIVSQNGKPIIAEVADNYKKYMNAKNIAEHINKFLKVEKPLKMCFENYIHKLELDSNAKPFYVISSSMHFADSVWWDTEIDLFSDYSKEGLSSTFENYSEIRKKFNIPEYVSKKIDINVIDSLSF